MSKTKVKGWKKLKVSCGLECQEKLEIILHGDRSASFKIVNAKGSRALECYLAGAAYRKLMRFFGGGPSRRT